MHGVGRAAGAITIVNALPTGVGCALGISLFAEAEVNLRPLSSRDEESLQVSPGPTTPLVRAAVRGALRRYAPDDRRAVNLSLRCEIPSARGLKSSSAVASAIILAVARAQRFEPTALEVAQLSAEVSRTAGVSATGAFDDALAGLASGFVVTDNALGTVLRDGPSAPDWVVTLFVPPEAHAPSPEWGARFKEEAREGRAAAETALQGDWWKAMALNTRLVERTMHYSYGPVRELLLREGALGAGVSGLGPALAAVGPQDRADAMLAALPPEGGERRTTRPLPADLVSRGSVP